MTSTSKFYLNNAQTFFDSTVNVDAEELYQHFLPLLPASGSVLDAGCGSGRDALAFKRKGFQVTAFDASESLADMASELIGQKVDACTFKMFEHSSQFDGIWACASLLHVPLMELSETVSHLSGFLVLEGYFYCSFKYGEGEAEVNERHFTYMNESGIEKLAEYSGLAVHKVWVTDDLRLGRANEKWLNAILHRAI